MTPGGKGGGGCVSRISRTLAYGVSVPAKSGPAENERTTWQIVNRPTIPSSDTSRICLSCKRRYTFNTPSNRQRSANNPVASPYERM